MNDNNTPEPVSDNQACEVPMQELLRSVPQDLRICIKIGSLGQNSTYIPVGVHCHDAADKIDALRAEVAKLKENADAFQVRLRAAQKCLQELSVLGGGNSHGNCIAIAGLKSSGNIDYGADIMEELAKSQKLIASLRQELTESQRMLEMRTQDRNSLHGELMREKAESSKWKEREIYLQGCVDIGNKRHWDLLTQIEALKEERDRLLRSIGHLNEIPYNAATPAKGEEKL